MIIADSSSIAGRMFSYPMASFRTLLAVSALALMAGAPLPALADPITPPVQIFPEQVPAPPSQERFESPLAAGTLTLQDVLEAHRPLPQPTISPPIGTGVPLSNAVAPTLVGPTQSSSTSQMMSQGMKAVLQKVGVPAAPAVRVGTPKGTAPTQALTAPASLMPAAPAMVDGVTYEPGQAPKNLATGLVAAPVTSASAPASGSAPIPTMIDTTIAVAPAVVPSPVSMPISATPASTDTSADSTACGHAMQKWEKSCAEAGYPASYLGKIVGETRTGCADGLLHDVWVTNSCAPPDIGNSQTAKTDGACGAASNNDFDVAPTDNLCAQGIPSTVSGEGPWTWACSGVNGGDAAACTAKKYVAAISGLCGSANGVAVSAAPSSDLCSSGKPSSITGDGPWSWSCKGTGHGSSQSCIAPVTGMTASTPAPAPITVKSAAPATKTAVAAPVMSAAEKGDLCGTASETLAYEKPDKDLCRVGSASAVNGDGPWSWSCTDNEGTTASCRTLSLNGDSASSEPAVPQAAPQSAVTTSPAATSSTGSTPHLQEQPFATASAPAAPVAKEVEPACGLAASQPAPQTPTAELCQIGKASAVRGSGPWHWTCSKGHRKTSCETIQMVDGSCGAANGAALKSAPFTGLCAVGTPSSIQGDGPWSWVCSGSGGGMNSTCAASLQTQSGKVDGACGTSDGTNVTKAPTDGLCASGAPSAVSGEGPWTWSCSGTNGGAVGSCSATKLTPTKAPGPLVNGLCGAANGVTAVSQPADALCSSGSVSGVVGNGPWNWSCVGENGGMTVSCTAPLEPPSPIDGACGGASGAATLVKPQSGLCAAGITGMVNGKGPWTWTCSGANGGVPASCVAPVAGKSVATPSMMTTSSSTPADDATPTAVATPSGLTTPHLPGSENIPSLSKNVLPSLTSSKAFASPPSPSNVPAATDPIYAAAPVTPTLPSDMQPLKAPSLTHPLSTPPALQAELAHSSASTPGNHLTLDPTISTVLFARGSGNIADNVISTLDRLSNVLIANPDVRISLIAYADSAGSTPRDARRLSLTRALAVRDYLASKGIGEARVDVHAEGANTTSGYIDRVDVHVNE